MGAGGGWDPPPCHPQGGRAERWPELGTPPLALQPPCKGGTQRLCPTLPPPRDAPSTRLGAARRGGPGWVGVPGGLCATGQGFRAWSKRRKTWWHRQAACCHLPARCLGARWVLPSPVLHPGASLGTSHQPQGPPLPTSIPGGPKGQHQWARGCPPIAPQGARGGHQGLIRPLPVPSPSEGGWQQMWKGRSCESLPQTGSRSASPAPHHPPAARPRVNTRRLQRIPALGPGWGLQPRAPIPTRSPRVLCPHPGVQDTTVV